TPDGAYPHYKVFIDKTISFLVESRFPTKRNSDFHAPDRCWISPRIIQGRLDRILSGSIKSAAGILEGQQVAETALAGGLLLAGRHSAPENSTV
ncbi:MAG: hypothetical protein J6B85_00335, partial [Lachnospiraceae bacterium]|nr:hypothetical protein [Lachnospiraceae bacterium]